MSLPKDLQDCVGDLPMTQVGTVALQQGLPAQGFAASGSMERFLPIAEQCFPIERAMESGGPFTLWEPSGFPSLLVVETDTDPILLRGQCEALKQGGLAVELTQPVTLRLGEWVLNLLQDRAELWRLPSPPKLPSTPLDLPALPEWPGVGVLLSGMRCPPWLESHVGAAARSPSPLGVLVAVGELVRLWSPTTPQDRKRCFELALQGRSARTEAARGWAQEQHDLGALMELAITSTVNLQEELLQCLELASDALAEALPALLLERDRLASVMQVFLLMGKGLALGRALEGLDAELSLHHTQLGELIYAQPQGEWGAAVRASDPEAWWVA